MYEALLHRTADELVVDGPLRRVLAPHEEAAAQDAVGLRLLGTVHRLVLERRAGDLALHYPSVGGRFELDQAWPALLEVLDRHCDALSEGMRRPPQTNEVGRAAALVGGLLRVLGAGTLPVRLHEIGASAGLNLLADQYRYVGVGGTWGPPASPVQLEAAWTGAPTPLTSELVVVERHGCDPDPIDPTSTAGRTLLTAYVWPDQCRRLKRLRGAFEVAGRAPVEVVRQSAADFMTGMRLADGHTTVLWHSVMWQYLTNGEKAAVTDQVRRLSAEASPSAPFVHVLLEPWRLAAGAPHDFLVVAATWPDGDQRVLGSASGHGVPVVWEQ